MYERIVVGTDGSPTATRAVDGATRLAVAHAAALIVVHSFPTRMSWEDRVAWEEAPEELRWRLSLGTRAEHVALDAVERARSIAGDDVDVSWWTEPGSAAHVLLASVARFDAGALVIGNRDERSGVFRRSLGRTLARRATCDLVVVDTVGRRAARLRTKPHQPGARLLPTE